MIDLVRFLRTLPNNTNVRIKVAGCDVIFSEKLTSANREAFIYDIFLRGKSYPEIYAIYPLWHTQELYIECM